LEKSLMAPKCGMDYDYHCVMHLTDPMQYCSTLCKFFSGAFAQNSSCGQRCKELVKEPQETGTLPARQAAGKGTVRDIYTFGAPAPGSFADNTTNSGFFKGLRFFTEDIGLVDFAPVTNFGLFPFMASAKMANNDTLEIITNNTPVLPEGPSDGKVPVASLHPIVGYIQKLQSALAKNRLEKPDYKPDVEKAIRMALLAAAAYREINCSTVQEGSPDWKIVHYHAVKDFLGGGLLNELTGEDTVTLFQAKNSTECALVFEGTDNAFEAITSVKQWAATFCGLPVFAGHRNELSHIFSNDAKVQDLNQKLGMCSSVTVTGHSLGGAVAHVYTACINSGHGPMHDKLVWNITTPTEMPGICEKKGKGCKKKNKKRANDMNAVYQMI